ncbi:Hypothetical protein c0854 [Escherichia coli CFT073]|uniref:Uncharacterized protein n=1 Tax=Escherichia coli O6:H1 (strain CFT073 / ATCC 700928 / UPEC) TaxID=199310 RepID=A0A0H2V5G0_ECOL6|nr:Hypothetical protein c0854 [Escherichia coli CFT073]
MRENNIGRHQVNQFAKRPDPDTLFDKEFLQRCHIHRTSGFDHADCPQYAHIGNHFGVTGGGKLLA